MTEPSATTLTALLDSHEPKATALIHDGRAVSYGELALRARRVATGLAGLGVGANDRVGLWLPNVPAWLVLQFACARLGAIAVSVNTRFRSAEIEDIVGRSGCKVLVLWPGFKGIDFAAILAGVAPTALAGLETIVAYGADGAGDVLAGRSGIAYDDLEACPPEERDLASPDAPCTIFTTSGTTRAPKFVLHRQAGIAEHARLVAAAFGYGAADAVLLQMVPLCGVFGHSQAMATLAAGRPMVLMELFDAAAAAVLLRRHRVTHTNGGDDMIERLLAESDAAHPFPALRHVGYARFNAALGDIVERADDRGVRLIGLYGMSEVQALFARQPPAAGAEQRKLAGGRLISDRQGVRARNPDSGAIQPHGESGELEVKGPSLMSEYWGDAETTAAAFTEDGYLRTGDLGYTTPENGFVFLSRMGDVLRLGGWLVSPDEIESYLRRHPAVDGAQVVGAEVDGRPRAIAFVTPAPGAEVREAELATTCRGGMAGFKVPARIFVLDEFPTVSSANGPKIQRARLRQWAEEWTRPETARSTS